MFILILSILLLLSYSNIEYLTNLVFINLLFANIIQFLIENLSNIIDKLKLIKELIDEILHKEFFKFNITKDNYLNNQIVNNSLNNDIVEGINNLEYNKSFDKKTLLQEIFILSWNWCIFGWYFSLFGNLF